MDAPEAPADQDEADICYPRDEVAAIEVLKPYRPMISSTPVLMSLLYDADMMPEQTVTVRGALSVAAVCEAYKVGSGGEGAAHKMAHILRGMLARQQVIDGEALDRALTLATYVQNPTAEDRAWAIEAALQIATPNATTPTPQAEDFADLRALAGKATPGDWRVEKGTTSMTHIRAGMQAICYLKTSYGRRSPSSDDDAAFIAAANPARILAMLDALDGRG